MYYIRENLIHLKNKNNVSLRTISSQTGLNIKTLSYILNKPSKNISLTSVDKIAMYFRISLDDFVHKDLSKENVPPGGTLKECIGIEK